MTSTPDQDGKVYHEVQYGQSLWSLAIAYGVKIDEIRALNNLAAEEIIYQGERLLVRVDTPAATVPTALQTDTATVSTTPGVLEPDTAPASPTALVFPTAFATQTPSQIPDVAIPDSPSDESVSSRDGGLSVGVLVGVGLLILMLVGLFTRYSATRT